MRKVKLLSVKVKMLFSALLLVFPLMFILSLVEAYEGALDIGSKLELFVDSYLIDSLDGATLKLHCPVNAGVALKFDKPWEGAFSGYCTVIHDGDLYRMYYRGLPNAGRDGSDDEVTCYAESSDGINWTKPNLALFEVNGIRANNVILAENAPYSHNFSPFIDTKPDIQAGERYKALAGTMETGLIAFVSADGLRWKKLREEPLITAGAFDSQNVAFWSESENCYVCYFRTWTDGGYKGYRTVSRSTSEDFLNWSEPVAMDFGDTPMEQLYTSQTAPYVRAPHIYVAIPMRFMPGRKVLTDDQAEKLGVNNKYMSDCAEAVLMSSRGGKHYDRSFMEGFIRPGIDLGNWASRAGMTALGIVETGLNELSLYKQAHYAQPSGHLLRYTLRTDGFVSVNAPYSGGEMTTNPLIFEGSELVLNMATSAAGYIKVALLDGSGVPISGYSLDASEELIGDSIERVVRWNDSASVERLAEKTVRIRFQMKDADLFSIRFK